MVFDQPAGFHHQIAHAPVHVTLGTFCAEFEKIERQNENPSGGKLMGDAHMGLIRITIIRTGEDHHCKFFRIRLQFGHRQFADCLHFCQTIQLFVQSSFKGGFGLFAFDAHLACSGEQRLAGIFDSPGKIDQRG